MFRALLLAPPGAGKGTQGEVFAQRHGVPHLATGDLLREHVSQGTDLGQAASAHMDAGRLVPDEVVIDMVLQRIGGPEGEAPMTDFLLDGFPRTLGQARAAYEWARTVGRTFHAVILLEVPEDELVRRLVQRGEEQGRSDDTEEVIRNRLRVYEASTAPLVDFYDERGILVRVDGTGPVEEVAERVEAALAPVLATRG
ncbi:MAG TPA: adenylate kinase [Acidimicrobiales bacterium]|nr:adenylate kinase [Acidimicrobiales bacterium]